MNYIKNWEDVVAHVMACYPNEACGYITTRNKFVPCKNIAEDPLNTFEMDNKILLKGNVKAILHSHTYNPNEILEYDPRIPSKADMQGQIDTGVEWAIVICEGENVTQPIWFGDRSHRPPLMDREFIHNAQDCLAFWTDWLYLEYKLDLPYHPRDWDWIEQGEDHFEEQYAAWNLVDVTDQPKRRGDITFYKIRSKVINHAGVMVDENTVAHHFFMRKPIIEPYSIWGNHCTKRVRHKDML